MTAARESEAPALLAEVTREAGKPLLVCRTGGTDVNFRDACRESGLIAFTSARVNPVPRQAPKQKRPQTQPKPPLRLKTRGAHTASF